MCGLSIRDNKEKNVCIISPLQLNSHIVSHELIKQPFQFAGIAIGKKGIQGINRGSIFDDIYRKPGSEVENTLVASCLTKILRFT